MSANLFSEPMSLISSTQSQFEKFRPFAANEEGHGALELRFNLLGG